MFCICVCCGCACMSWCFPLGRNTEYRMADSNKSTSSGSSDNRRGRHGYNKKRERPRTWSLSGGNSRCRLKQQVSVNLADSSWKSSCVLKMDASFSAETLEMWNSPLNHMIFMPHMMYDISSSLCCNILSHGVEATAPQGCCDHLIMGWPEALIRVGQSQSVEAEQTLPKYWHSF